MDRYGTSQIIIVAASIGVHLLVAPNGTSLLVVADALHCW